MAKRNETTFQQFYNLLGISPDINPKQHIYYFIQFEQFQYQSFCHFVSGNIFGE